MIDLSMYGPGDVVSGPHLVSFEKDARSGKGTSGEEVSEALRGDGRSVLAIDQGLKFRVLGYGALALGVDLDHPVEVESFLESEVTRDVILESLGRFSMMSKAEVQDVLYPSHIASAAQMMAKYSGSHKLAVGIMFDQVTEAKEQGVDTVLIDGRAMEQYGRQMHAEKLGLYCLAWYFECDSFFAAQRVLKDFRDPKSLSVDEKAALLDAVVNIAYRNRDDAGRNVDPMVGADHAFNLDLLRGLPEDPDERQDTLDQIIETGIVTVDTSYTTDVSQMTEPVVEITRHVLKDADRRRRSHNMSSKACRAAFSLTPEPANG